MFAFFYTDSKHRKLHFAGVLELQEQKHFYCSSSHVFTYVNKKYAKGPPWPSFHPSACSFSSTIEMIWAGVKARFPWSRSFNLVPKYSLSTCLQANFIIPCSAPHHLPICLLTKPNTWCTPTLVRVVSYELKLWITFWQERKSHFQMTKGL